MRNAVALALIVYFILGAMLTASQVGKQRMPIDGTTAAAVTLISAVQIAAVGYLAWVAS
jgi:hypothetical protein